MSGQVVGDPDEIEAFSRQLNAYCNETRDALSRVKQQLVQMESNQTWADDRYRQYWEQFDEASRRIEGTLETMESEHVPHLISLAEKLRAYHE